MCHPYQTSLLLPALPPGACVMCANVVGGRLSFDHVKSRSHVFSLSLERERDRCGTLKSVRNPSLGNPPSLFLLPPLFFLPSHSIQRFGPSPNIATLKNVVIIHAIVMFIWNWKGGYPLTACATFAFADIFRPPPNHTHTQFLTPNSLSTSSLPSLSASFFSVPLLIH